MNSKELLQKLRLTEKYTIISLILLGIFVLFFFNPQLFTGFITGEDINISKNNSLQFEISFNESEYIVNETKTIPEEEIKKPYIELTNKYGYLTGHKDVQVNHEKTDNNKNAYDITLSSSPGIAELVHVGEIPEAVVEIKGLKINKVKENESLPQLKAVIDSIDTKEKRKIDERKIKPDNSITGGVAKTGEVTIVEEIRTSVLAIESYEIESATLTLPKVSAGKIDAIYRCNEFNVDKFSCVSGWDKTTIPFTDNGDTITFTVDHFSAYAAGGDNQTNSAQLTIWDDSDNVTKTNNKDIVFYADYVNATHDAITVDGVYCNISFDDGQKAVMQFNATSQRYEYNRKFAYGGEYQFTVACVGADAGYTNLQATDIVVVEEVFVVGGLAVPTHSAPILNTTNNINLTCWNQSTADTDGGYVKNIFNWYRGGASMIVLNMPFEGDTNSSNAKDYSGSISNGTIVGATWNATGGYDGKGAFYFDGNDKINVPNNILNVSNNLSVSVWIKADTLSSRHAVYSTRINNDQNAWQLEVGIANGGTNRVAVTGVSTWILQTSNNAITTGSWYHIVYTRSNDNKTDKIYINGVNQTGTTINSYTFVDNTFLKGIGYGTSGLQYFTGGIDDLIVFNYELSQAQVTELYQNKTNTFIGNETLAISEFICSVTPNDGTSDGATLNSSAASSNYPNCEAQTTTGSWYINSLVIIDKNITCANITMGASGKIQPGNRSWYIISSENLTMIDGSVMNFTAMGFNSSTGSGVGSNSATDGGGGAGYGGIGGKSSVGIIGGGTYGSALHPTDLGSGGGNGNTQTGNMGYGAQGGGSITINISKNFEINGSVLANGGNPANQSSIAAGGGGSGGSVYVVANNISGSGYFLAQGGTSGQA
ncbi:LamG domain-containing protein, partial [Candidatus Woesearchaeota archaeon]|nr:LamG domain-containing protein [Candidatus Woesearchaeota archaeon]